MVGVSKHLEEEWLKEAGGLDLGRGRPSLRGVSSG